MIKRRLLWFIGNVVQIGGMCWIIHTESTQWGRVARLWLWMFGLFAFIVWTLALASVAVAPEKIDKELKVRSVPVWLAVACDFTVAGMCAYVGWVATAVMWGLACLYEQLSMSVVAELVKEKK